MEKFIVSARKYRPQTFDTVVGQQHITTTLKNAIRNHQLAHAFLFCGPRGVGKTTCARILAKTINCENPTPEGEACNHCHSCKSFNEGTSLNIHELDAASNNSVDDIRALVEQVRFAPQAGKYKVYIIDEVHMLSSSAFNAFLKTLEEPPPYAIFILATTEKHKILPTILSRCQIFDFKRITLQDTVDHLHGIAIKEGIQTDEAGLQMIAQKSEGCMRDALSILDKIVSFTGGQVSYTNTLEHLNILDADYYFKLIDNMLKQDLAGAMLLYDDINKKGFEGDSVLNGFAEFARNLLICKDERVAGLLEVVESFRQRYAETAQKTEAGYLVSILNILAEAELNYKAARNKRLHVEMALIKLCYLRQALQLTSDGSTVDKKKVVDTARAVAFKNINPISVQPDASAPVNVPKPAPTPAPAVKPSVASAVTKQQPEEAKLIIETEPVHKQAVIKEPKTAYTPPPPPSPPAPGNTKSKLGSLQSLRQQIQEVHNNQVIREDLPLEMSSLRKAWDKFIEQLKAEKNPAWQSFEVAELMIKDANSFDATANNNINQKFLDFERNKVSEFLKHELHNRQLQFSVILIETEQIQEVIEVPLTSKQQYQKIIEQFPIVQELRERLRLELDF
ncbi:DNA polymerase III subunit gamma/tau [Chitinophagaceae bacterium LB-8]|uniref:DNA polymerase III subunit gamma/tau n=1 Tax=Paraflavisolibacter caeni TaxID=2982496 RepID=A0A9X2XSS4_9BACT|nr:DNA polymerase III subunit gamma/tau [Paraflavisolibacter caeni]MCU7547692.1 DNA polymerase III subunit gamma/tau [Paraflavisolibacter caeni]